MNIRFDLIPEKEDPGYWVHGFEALGFSGISWVRLNPEDGRVDTLPLSLDKADMYFASAVSTLEKEKGTLLIAYNKEFITFSWISEYCDCSSTKAEKPMIKEKELIPWYMIDAALNDNIEVLLIASTMIS